MVTNSINETTEPARKVTEMPKSDDVKKLVSIRMLRRSKALGKCRLDNKKKAR